MIGGRRLSLFALVAGAGVLGVLAACDSFRGEELPGAPVDAGASNVADAAAAADGGAPVEAGTEAGGAPFACPIGYLLCDDFERASLQGLWTAPYGPAGLLAIDDAFSSSPTRSLRATPNADKGAVLALDVSKPAISALEVTFSLRIDSTAGDYAQVVTIELDRLNSYVVAEVRGEMLALVEQFEPPDGGAVFYDTRPVAMPPIGAFERYRLRVDIEKGTFSLAAVKSPVGTPDRVLVHKHSSVSTVLVGAAFAGTRKAPHWIDDVVVTKL